jgi:hypothetical protein
LICEEQLELLESLVLKVLESSPAGPQGWSGRKQGKMISELKIGFLNLPKLWKFVDGDLGGILTIYNRHKS